MLDRPLGQSGVKAAKRRLQVVRENDLEEGRASDRAADTGVLVIAAEGLPAELLEQSHGGLLNQRVFAVAPCRHESLPGSDLDSQLLETV